MQPLEKIQIERSDVSCLLPIIPPNFSRLSSMGYRERLPVLRGGFAYLGLKTEVGVLGF